MNRKELLIKEYRSLNSDKEKLQFFEEALSLIGEIHRNDTAAIANLKAECDALNSKVSRASALIKDAQNEAELSRKAAISDTRKKLQIVRDRLFAIISTAKALEVQTNGQGEREVMSDMLNNIVASVDIIANELATAGLWDHSEGMPVVKKADRDISQSGIQSDTKDNEM